MDDGSITDNAKTGDKMGLYKHLIKTRKCNSSWQHRAMGTENSEAHIEVSQSTGI